MNLKDKLKDMKFPKLALKEPLWKGPEVDGITFSLLSRYLSCKERFRIHTMEGLRAQDQYNRRIEYGVMWHIAEESLARGSNKSSKIDQWESAKEYVQKLLKKYPLAQEQIVKDYRTLQTQFPVYVDYWRKNKEVINRKPLLQEYAFAIPYELPSKRIVTLRGKFDSVDIILSGKQQSIYLQENKTKGDINEGQIKRQLTFDLQTMIYLTTLREMKQSEKLYKITNSVQLPNIKGVRYNVVRRPFSGGRGNIVQHKPTKSNPQGESTEAFFERFKNDYLLDDPGYWFMRWTIDVTPHHIEIFRQQCLDHLLENLYDDYEWWSYCWEEDRCVYNEMKRMKQFPDHRQRHWRHPFGVYNVLDEGGSHDLDNYLETGSEIGLERSETLFPELS